MFSYYSPLSRRKSSNPTSPNLTVTTGSPTLPQTLSQSPTSPSTSRAPFASAMNEAALPLPLPSPSSHSHSSPGRSARKKSMSGLGSPFSVHRAQPTSAAASASAPQRTDVGIDAADAREAREAHRDVMTSGGSRTPLISRDFAAGSSTSTDRPRQSQTRNYPVASGSKAEGTTAQGDATGRSNPLGGLYHGHSSESFFPLREELDEDEENSRSNQSNLSPASGSGFSQASPAELMTDRAVSQPPARRTTASATAGPSNPLAIPPPSIHDDYVSNFIKPLAPPSSLENRPSIVRAATAPGVPNFPPLPSASTSGTAAGGGGNGVGRNGGDPPLSAIDTATASTTTDSGAGAGAGPASSTAAATPADRQPIFEIFNAELGEDGERLSHLLRNHLEDVLRGQERVGKMHLALERLSVDDDDGIWRSDRSAPGADGEGEGEGQDEKAAEEEKELWTRREKGVEEIMQRLDTLSDTLRTYHQLGTPKLTFHQPASAREKMRSQSIAVADLDRDRQSVSNNPLKKQYGSDPEPKTPTNSRPAGDAGSGDRRNESPSPITPTDRNTSPLAFTKTNLSPYASRKQNHAQQAQAPAHMQGHGKAHPKPRSPLVNTFRPDLSSSANTDSSFMHESIDEGDESSRAGERDEGRGNRGSDLVPLKLEVVPSPRTFRAKSRERQNEKDRDKDRGVWPLHSHQEGEDEHVNHTKNEMWFDHRHQHGDDGIAQEVDRPSRVRTITDSPIEMVERSRF